jgi:hypothetical protein
VLQPPEWTKRTDAKPHVLIVYRELLVVLLDKSSLTCPSILENGLEQQRCGVLDSEKAKRKAATGVFGVQLEVNVEKFGHL